MVAVVAFEGSFAKRAATFCVSSLTLLPAPPPLLSLHRQKGGGAQGKTEVDLDKVCVQRESFCERLAFD